MTKKRRKELEEFYHCEASFMVYDKLIFIIPFHEKGYKTALIYENGESLLIKYPEDEYETISCACYGVLTAIDQGLIK